MENLRQPHPCERCGTWIEHPNQRGRPQRFCSKKCKDGVLGLRAFTCQVCARRWQAKSEPGRPPAYCSEDCRKEAARARAREWYYENPERAAGQPSRQPDYKSAAWATYYEVNREALVQHALDYVRDHSEQIREYRRRPEVREAQRIRVAKARQTPESRQKMAERQKDPEYRAKQSRRQVEYDKVRRSRDPEYRQKMLAKTVMRRALTRGAPDAELFTLDEIYQRDHGICYLCGKEVDHASRTMDHVIPVVLGGPHTRANVRLACRSCNSRKRHFLVPEGFYVENDEGETDGE